ncbi:YfcE family phosphodiesterase, partial [candidate division KSB1 bacterium]
MRYAIIADIHSNLPALQAVLFDIEKYGVDEIVCAG